MERFSIYNIKKSKVGKKIVLKEIMAEPYRYRNSGHAVAYARISYARRQKDMEDVIVKDENGQLIFSAKENAFFEEV